MPLQLSETQRILTWAALGGLLYLRVLDDKRSSGPHGAAKKPSAREVLDAEVQRHDELADEVAADARVTQSRHLNTRAERPELIIPPRVGRYDDPTVEEHVVAQFGAKPRSAQGLPGEFRYDRFRLASAQSGLGATERSVGRDGAEMLLV